MKIGRLLLFLLGLFFLALSSFSIGPMIMEYVYQAEMANHYNIKEINAHYAGASKTYEFSGNTITASHSLTGEEPYLDGWDDLVYPADITLSVNDKVIEVLEKYPVQLTSGQYQLAVEGLNQYTHYLSYWLVEDQRNDKEFFAITFQLNGYDTKQIDSEGFMEGYVDQEEFEYKLITIQEDGTVDHDFFTYQNKNKLQTQLITPMYAGQPGYHTDSLRVWPSAFFPLIYPFLSTLVGIILTFAFFPYQTIFRRRKQK